MSHLQQSHDSKIKYTYLLSLVSIISSACWPQLHGSVKPSSKIKPNEKMIQRGFKCLIYYNYRLRKSAPTFKIFPGKL